MAGKFNNYNTNYKFLEGLNDLLGEDEPLVARIYRVEEYNYDHDPLLCDIRAWQLNERKRRHDND